MLLQIHSGNRCTEFDGDIVWIEGIDGVDKSVVYDFLDPDAGGFESVFESPEVVIACDPQ